MSRLILIAAVSRVEHTFRSLHLSTHFSVLLSRISRLNSFQSILLHFLFLSIDGMGILLEVLLYHLYHEMITVIVLGELELRDLSDTIREV